MIASIALLISSATLHDTDLVYDSILVPRTETALYASIRGSTSPTDSTPLDGARVVVTVGDLEVGRAFSDATGRAVVRFVVPELEPGGHTLKVSTTSSHGTDVVSRTVTIEEHTLLSVRTDRTVYRPGETIHYAVALINRADAHPIGGAEVEISVKDPRGTQIWRGRVRVDATGFGAGRLPLGDDLRLGAHRIEASAGAAKTSHEVSVREIELPAFFVTIESTSRLPLPRGAPFEGTIVARYPYGEPVHGSVAVGDMRGTLDVYGRYAFSIANPGEELEATVTDGADRSEVATLSIPPASSRTSIAIVPEHGSFQIGQRRDVFVVTTDGERFSKRLVTLTAEGATIHGPTEVVSTGAIRISLTPDRSAFRISARSGDAMETIDLAASNGSEGFIRSSHAVIDPRSSIEIHGRFRKPAGAVALTLIRERTPVAMAIVETDRLGRFHATIAAPEGVFGLATLRATEIAEDGRSATAPIYLAPTPLRVLIEGRTRFRPGENAELLAVVTDDRGAPAEGVGLFASVVDERALAIGKRQKDLTEILRSLDVENARVLGIAFTELLGRRGTMFEVARRAIVEALPTDDRPPLLHFDAVVRRQAEETRIESYHDPVVEALADLPMPIGRRAGKRWRYVADLAAVLTAIGLDSKDPWSRPLDWSYAELHAPSFAFHRIAELVAERRLERIRTAISTKGLEHRGLDLAALFDAAGLDENARLDPWGRRLSLARGAGGTTIRSLGPDGLAETKDDLILFDVFNEHGNIGIGGLGTHGYGYGGGGAGYALGGMSGRSASISAPAIRARFDETVLWVAGLRTDRNGEAKLPLAFSDSVTGWRLSIDALGPKGSVGHGEKQLETFLPLSVDANVPRALTTGDRFTLSAVAANHTEADQDLEIEIFTTGPVTSMGDSKKRIALPKGATRAVSLPIAAREPGDATVKLVLSTADGRAVDAVERNLRVDGPGRMVEVALADTLDEGGALAFTMSDRPALASFEGVLRLFRGPLDQALDGIEDLLQEPHGCFEQTSSATYPNLMVLDLLGSKETHAEIRQRAHDLVARGYQRLISYEVDGGGFSWFGDAPANQALTAYGLLEFVDMAKVYPVDPELIARTRTWLLSKQSADGAFRPDERWLHDWSAVEGELSMTAYIAWALSESGESGPELDKAFAYLERNRRDLESRPFLLALWAAGESLRSKAKAKEVLSALAKHEIEGDGLAFTAGGETLFYAKGQAADVQVTSLAATALLRIGRTSEAREAFEWIWSARTPRYGWGTPQGTVLALRMAAALDSTPPPSGSVAIALDGEKMGQIDLGSPGVPAIRLPGLEMGAHRLAVESDGSILADLRLSWRSDGEPLPLDRGLRVDLEVPSAVRFGQSARVLVRITNTTSERIAMPTAVIPTPPGFAPDRRSLRALESSGLIDRFETQGAVHLYMTEVKPKQSIELAYELTAEAECDVTMRGARAFAYYDPDTFGESGNLRIATRD